MAQLTQLQGEILDNLKLYAGRALTVTQIWKNLGEWNHSRSGVGSACIRLSSMGKIKEQWGNTLTYVYQGAGTDGSPRPDNSVWRGAESEVCGSHHSGFTCRARKRHTGDHKGYYGQSNEFGAKWKNTADSPRVPDAGDYARLRDKTASADDHGRQAAFLRGVLERRTEAGDDRKWFTPGQTERELFVAMSQAGLLNADGGYDGKPLMYSLTERGTRLGREWRPGAAVAAARKGGRGGEKPVIIGNEYWRGEYSEYCQSTTPGGGADGKWHCKARAGHAGEHRAYITTGTCKATWVDGERGVDESPPRVRGSWGNEPCNGKGEQCFATTPRKESPHLNWICTAREGHQGNHRAYNTSGTDPSGRTVKGKGWAAEWDDEGIDPHPRPSNERGGRSSEWCREKIKETDARLAGQIGYNSSYSHSPDTWTCEAVKGHRDKHRAYNSSDNDPWGNYVGSMKGYCAEWGAESRVVGNRQAAGSEKWCERIISSKDKRLMGQRSYSTGLSGGTSSYSCRAREGHSGAHRAYDSGTRDAWGTYRMAGQGFAAEWSER